MAFDFIQSALSARDEEGLLRRRQCVQSSGDMLVEVGGQHYLNFASNDYLGLRHSTEVMQAWVDGMSVHGGGSGASPLVSGYSKAHRELEDFIADGLNREAALVFNSGFAANQAVCQALLHKDSQVLADKLIHASFIDGALASPATFRRFRHNDTEHLQDLLSQGQGDVLVATEGVFSMDGDSAPLNQITTITRDADAWLMVDDAHGFGILGDSGLGSAQALGLSQSDVPVLMGTFGKAVGTAGAFVAGSRALIDYLVNFARHYIYSTAMPPGQASATLTSLRLIDKGKHREQLFNNIAYFRRRCDEQGITLLPSDSAVQPIVIGDASSCLAAAEQLKKLGLWVGAIRTPTVPKGTDRLRITLSAAHQTRDLDALVDGLGLVLNAVACESSRA